MPIRPQPGCCWTAVSQRHCRAAAVASAAAAVATAAAAATAVASASAAATATVVASAAAAVPLLLLRQLPPLLPMLLLLLLRLLSRCCGCFCCCCCGYCGCLCCCCCCCHCCCWLLKQHVTLFVRMLTRVQAQVLPAGPQAKSVTELCLSLIKLCLFLTCVVGLFGCLSLQLVPVHPCRSSATRRELRSPCCLSRGFRHGGTTRSKRGRQAHKLTEPLGHCTCALTVELRACNIQIVGDRLTLGPYVRLPIEHDATTSLTNSICISLVSNVSSAILLCSLQYVPLWDTRLLVLSPSFHQYCVTNSWHLFRMQLRTVFRT